MEKPREDGMMYLKVEPIYAVQVTEDGPIEHPAPEGPTKIRAGYYLCEGVVDNYQWPIPANIFERIYIKHPATKPAWRRK